MPIAPYVFIRDLLYSSSCTPLSTALLEWVDLRPEALLWLGGLPDFAKYSVWINRFWLVFGLRFEAKLRRAGFYGCIGALQSKRLVMSVVIPHYEAV